MSMMLAVPQVAKQEPRCIVGCYCTFEGDDEGPGWSGAHAGLMGRIHEIPNRIGDARWWFLYRPHKDHPEISPDVRSAFGGVEVPDFTMVADGLSTTRFAGGDYIFVEIIGDSENEAGEGVGPAVQAVEDWLRAHEFGEGDEGALVCEHESVSTPPHRLSVCARIVR